MRTQQTTPQFHSVLEQEPSHIILICGNFFYQLVVISLSTVENEHTWIHFAYN